MCWERCRTWPWHRLSTRCPPAPTGGSGKHRAWHRSGISAREAAAALPAHTPTGKGEPCTYRLDVPKALGRAVRDGSQQEPPGCRDQLQGILHNSHGGETSPSEEKQEPPAHSRGCHSTEGKGLFRVWEQPWQFLSAPGDEEPAQAPSVLHRKVGAREMLQVLLQGKS